MTFREFLKEDAGVAGATVQGKWGDDGENLGFERRGIRSKYTAPTDPIKMDQPTKTDKFFMKKKQKKN